MNVHIIFSHYVHHFAHFFVHCLLHNFTLVYTMTVNGCLVDPSCWIVYYYYFNVHLDFKNTSRLNKNWHNFMKLPNDNESCVTYYIIHVHICESVDNVVFGIGVFVVIAISRGTWIKRWWNYWSRVYTKAVHNSVMRYPSSLPGLQANTRIFGSHVFFINFLNFFIIFWLFCAWVGKHFYRWYHASGRRSPWHG